MQLTATTAAIISNLHAGYGHRKITILVNDEYQFSYTTSAVYITDNLGDDDELLHNNSVEALIDSCLSANNVEVSDSFTYQY